MIGDNVDEAARLRDLEDRHLSKVLHRTTEVFVERGSGSYVYTPSGERYLDFVMGIASVNTGHSHPKVLAAAKAQIDRVVHPSTSAVRYGPIIELAAKLAEITPPGLDVAFFGNSGAEAVEGALKLAKYTTRRPGIIAFQGGFHGRTIGAVSVTSSKALYRKGYEPLVPSTYFAPFPHAYRCPLGHSCQTSCQGCIQFLEHMLEQVIDPRSVAAVLIEPVQGEGGYIPAPTSYLRALRDLCTRHGILLMFDEVQSGFGRTGRWWAGQHHDVTPDIQIMAKGIASGFPLSAVSSTREIMNRWSTGSHGSTFGGNPVSCAAACATIDVIREEGMVENAARMGERLRARLLALKDQYPIIGDVRGLGLMLAAEFVEPDGSPSGRLAEEVRRAALERNMLLLTCGLHDQCIRFIPPLNVNEWELSEGIEVFSEAVKLVTSRR